MEHDEFSRIRIYLDKTQRALAQLLGVSLKAVQSFEQGWRKIPPHVERHLLFLLWMKATAGPDGKSCWQVKKCTGEKKRECPAFEYRAGDLCWFVNGTFCRGRDVGSWQEKMKQCRLCQVFLSSLPEGLLDSGPS